MFLLPFVSSVLTVLILYRFAGFLQLNTYLVGKCLKNYAAKEYAEYTVLTSAGLFFLAVSVYIESIAVLVGLYAVYVVFAALFTVIRNVKLNKNAKTPLVFTNRVKRLYAAVFLCNLLLFGALYFLCGVKYYFIIAYLIFCFYTADFALISAFASVFERANNRRYVKRAAARLSGFKTLIRVGITGSYGKTSVKNIFALMAEKRYRTVATEKNFNTPLGIAKSVERLNGETEIFVAEMGARRRGEIAELCAVVCPDYGILTGITAQHMETFKTIEAVSETKSELFYALKAGGVCVLNADDGHIRGLPFFDAPNVLRAGTANASEGDAKSVLRAGTAALDCYAENLIFDSEGSRFELCFGYKPKKDESVGITRIARKKKITVATSVVGRANVVNITVAAALAYYIGVSADKIAEAIADIVPVPHRTEIIKSGRLTVIDDTYNSNPVGACAALETLRLFEGRHIVVACGFAEQGKNLESANRAFGRDIAAAAEFAVLIGTGAKFIRDGLTEHAFPSENIREYPTLAAAKREFSSLFRQGDVVLFENDMPDNL
ncbi:MAG: UDP-N-acetylmuramoyl-tripeptide--D-alanyl-D-alanine ligase [Clostridiales bacterium]|nr:UDP-N-acetylmuramoyl-tripeptide--D-alanyl-D-alanine ligase [Clostridiales bacterium]